MFRDIFLPFISFVSGLVSLYIDPKTDHAKAWVVVLVLAASVTATGYYSFQDEKTQAANALQAQKQEQDIQKDLDRVTSYMQSGGGLQSNEGDSEATPAPASTQAPASVAPATAQQTTPPAAQKPIIEYFVKQGDSDTLGAALLKTGFGVVKVPGQRAENTNCIWVGDSVQLADAKSVALALVNAGVPLRAIRNFRDGSGRKANLIEIGADHALENAPLLTVDEIQNMNASPPRSMNMASAN
jgi:hypothetical protein